MDIVHIFSGVLCDSCMVCSMDGCMDAGFCMLGHVWGHWGDLNTGRHHPSICLRPHCQRRGPALANIKDSQEQGPSKTLLKTIRGFLTDNGRSSIIGSTVLVGWYLQASAWKHERCEPTWETLMSKLWHRTSPPPPGTSMTLKASLGRSGIDQRRVCLLCRTFSDTAVTSIVSLQCRSCPAQVGLVSCRTKSTGSLYRCRNTASLTCFPKLVACFSCTAYSQWYTTEVVINCSQHTLPL